MFLVIFLVWLLLNAHFAWDIQFLQIVLFGLALSTIIYFFVIKFTSFTFKTDIFFITHIHLFIAYGAVLFYNVIISNFKIISLILKPHEAPKPLIVSFNVPLKNTLLRAILANSITLTPGTISISCTQDHFIVHCLKKEYFDGFENSLLVKLLLKMEAK
ncbi:MAG: Na+/H+ antiporter subunit E [Bacilli bacterium]